ncbi:MAG: GNAT family N-acetyltransferase [Agarilytica sp.]
MIHWHLRDVTEVESDAYLTLSRENMMPYFEALNIPWDQEERRYFREQALLQKIIDTASDTTLGYLLLFSEMDRLYIYDLQLHKKARKQKLGSEVLKHLINKAKAENKNLRLGTFKINPATNLYLRLGFKIIKTNEIFNWFQFDVNGFK